ERARSERPARTERPARPARERNRSRTRGGATVDAPGSPQDGVAPGQSPAAPGDAPSPRPRRRRRRPSAGSAGVSNAAPTAE
ncbi:MAG: ATP-dependent helicase, partial [Actinomycetota bacterium]|nr:ATP-dependent helicase [Actinomycetota bacterium]